MFIFRYIQILKRFAKPKASQVHIQHQYYKSTYLGRFTDIYYSETRTKTFNIVCYRLKTVLTAVSV